MPSTANIPPSAKPPVPHRRLGRFSQPYEPQPGEGTAGEPSLGSPPSPLRTATVETVGAALGLAATLIAVKLWLLPFPVETVGQFVRWCLRLAVVAAADVLFVVVSAALVCGTLQAFRCRPKILRWVSFAARFAFAAAAMYGVVSVTLFRVMMTPLTVQLLGFSGGPGLMSSSIASFLSWGSCWALAVAPLWVWVAGRLLFHVTRKWNFDAPPKGWSLRLGSVVVGLSAVYAGVASAYVESNWTDPNRWERRIACSPHAVLLRSCVDSLLQTNGLSLDESSDEVDLSDFTPRSPADSSVVETDPSTVRPQPNFAVASRPTNVFLLVLESVGAEYLSLYGSRHDTTPNLNRLAADHGVTFDNLYVQSPSSCKSLVALTASAYPRIDWKLTVRDCPGFNAPTLAQSLSTRGYRNAFLHSGYWSWKNRDQYLAARGADALIDADKLPEWQVSSWGVSDRAMLQSALRWIDADRSRPFHVTAWTIETHHPYIALDEPIDFGVDDPELNRYLNAVRSADAHIAWLVEELNRRGLLESTLIVVTGDHGELFGQHNQRVHNFGVYEESVKTPLVLLHPSLSSGPKRISEVRQQIDLPPTILDLLGLPRPAAWQGVSLLSPPRSPRAYFFALGNQAILGLRDGPWKYHFHVSSGRHELYHLPDDPHERRDQSALHPALCSSYLRRLNGLNRTAHDFHARHNPE